MSADILHTDMVAFLFECHLVPGWSFREGSEALVVASCQHERRETLQKLLGAEDKHFQELLYVILMT